MHVKCVRGVCVRAFFVVAIAILAGESGRLAAAPAAPTMNAPVVNGNTVLLSWSAVAGATSYRLGVGLSPGTELYTQNVGPVTQVNFASPYTGTGYVHVYALDASGASPRSNSVPLTVGGPSPPAALTNLQSSVTGNHVTLTWAAGSGGGAPLNVEVEAGTAPGAANVGTFPVGLTAQASVGNVPNGAYYVRVFARNVAGRSPASNEIRVDVPSACGAPPAPSVSSSVNGATVTIAWTPSAGAAAFRLDASTSPGGPLVASQTYPMQQTSATFPNVASGTYYVRVTALAVCGTQSTSAEATVTVASQPRYRTPNPPPGGVLPLPNQAALVHAVGAQYRGDLLNSCGNNTFLFRLVQALRQTDTRWGLNWKRAVVGDMSQDAVTYNWGSEADEGTLNVYVVDVIGSHCGSNPTTAWIDQTVLGSTGAKWTLQPYLAAGGQP